jgi:hypothetical protein
MHMNANKSLLSAGLGVVRRSKRYVVWFFLLNLTLASLGAAVFRVNAGTILNNSLESSKLTQGFDLATFIELLARPEVGSMQAVNASAFDFAFLFFLLTLFFLPGVFLGYASDHRLPRPEFFRACGANFWRFVRILIFYLFIAGIPIGILFGIQKGIDKAADHSTNELLPFTLQMICFAVIFLVAMFFRAWFDQAEVEIVLRDQNAVRKAIGPARRRTSFGLWATYLFIAVLAGIFLTIGLWLWHSIVPPSGVLGAFIISQLTLLVWLKMRFWQRACAVVYYERQQEMPVAEAYPSPVIPTPVMPAGAVQA